MIARSVCQVGRGARGWIPSSGAGTLRQDIPTGKPGPTNRYSTPNRSSVGHSGATVGGLKLSRSHSGMRPMHRSPIPWPRIKPPLTSQASETTRRRCEHICPSERPPSLWLRCEHSGGLGGLTGDVTACEGRHHRAYGPRPHRRRDRFGHGSDCCQDRTIEGIVTGSVAAREQVDIHEIGSLDGNVIAPCITLVEYAYFCGTVTRPPLGD